jgi:hypothetical protein
MKFLRDLAAQFNSKNTKNPEQGTIVVCHAAKELEFYKDWLKNPSKEWSDLQQQIKDKLTSTDKSDEKKCDEINLLVLNAQLERQTAKSIKQSEALSLGKLTRISAEMINVIQAKCGDIDNIKTLSICDGAVNHLPSEMTNFKSLKTLHLTNNAFTTPPLPGSLPAKLSFLNLNHNPIQSRNTPHYPKELSVNFPVPAAKPAKKN